MTKVTLIIPSTSTLNNYYNVIIDSEEKSVICDCKSGQIRGYCKHIKFYKSLIRAIIHENPRLNVEKKGN